MTVITGTIKSAAGELSDGTLTVKANKIYGYAGAVIDGNQYDVDVIDGVFTTPDVAPGPVKLTADCGNWRKTFDCVLPDQETIDFWDLVESVLIYEPPVVSTVVQAKDDAIAAKDAAQDILDQVEAGAVPDSAVASKVTDTSSQTRTALNSIYATHKNLARNPDLLIAGTITRNGNGAATTAPVVWPDGTPGTYTATTLSSAFPGAVDAYTITYGSPVTKTYTQPAVTRDANGAPTAVPAIVVS